MVLSREDRQTRGRIGAFALHATHDPKITTIPGRRAFLQRFLDAIPADLPEEERLRRAQCALKAHTCRLAFNSAKVRRQRKEARTGGAK